MIKDEETYLNLEKLSADWFKIVKRHEKKVGAFACAREMIILNTKLLLDRVPQDDPEMALDIAREAFKEAIDWHTRAAYAQE